MIGPQVPEAMNGLMHLERPAFVFDYDCTTIFVALKNRGIPDKWFRLRMLLPYTSSQARHLKNPPLPRELWQHFYKNEISK